MGSVRAIVLSRDGPKIVKKRNGQHDLDIKVKGETRPLS